MASLNKVLVIGNLGRDPELRHTQSGTAVCNFSVAATDTYQDASGERQESTEWFNIVVFGRQGENCAKYLAKGRPVFVEGRLQTRKYQDKEGQDRYRSEVIAQRVQFLGGGGQGGQGGGGGSRGGSGGGFDDGYSGPMPGGGDDDIPF
jgi:single-strand DNA-binding protein